MVCTISEALTISISISPRFIILFTQNIYQYQERYSQQTHISRLNHSTRRMFIAATFNLKCFLSTEDLRCETVPLMKRRDICNPEPIPYQTHTPRLVKIYQDKMLTHKHFPKTIKIIKTSIKTGTLCVCDKDWGGGSTWGRTGGCGVSKRRYLGVRKDYPLCSSVIFHTSH